MTTIQLELDEQTLQQAKKIAVMRQATLESLIQEVIQNLATHFLKEDPILGLFANESDLMDEIVETILQSHETTPLRQPNG